MRTSLVPALLFLAVAVATPVYSEVAGSSLALPDAATDPGDPRVNQTLVSKMVAFNAIEPGPGTKAEKDAVAGALLKEIETLLPREEFIRQCGLLLGANERNPAFAVNPMLMGYILNKRLRVTDKELLIIFLPLWVDGDAPKKKAIAVELSAIDKVAKPASLFFDANLRLHFEILAEWKAANNPLQHALIDLMFELSPGAALVDMLREEGVTGPEIDEFEAQLSPVEKCYYWRGIESGPDLDTIRKAHEALDVLAADNNPWKRLFAAEMYRSVSLLRTEALEATLRKQANPLIQSRLESATQDPSAEDAAAKKP